MQAHRLQQVTEITEGIRAQHVVVGGDAARIIADGAIQQRNDKDLRQRKSDPLAQLVVTGDGLLPERFKKIVLVQGLSIGQRCADTVHIAAMQFLRLGKLRIQPGGIAAGAEGRDIGAVWAEAGLGQPARCLCRAWRRQCAAASCVAAAAGGGRGAACSP